MQETALSHEFEFNDEEDHEMKDSRMNTPESFSKLRMELAPLQSLKKAAMVAEEISGTGFLRDLLDEINDLINSAYEAVAPRDLPWDQENPDRFTRECRLARAALRKFRGIPLIGRNEDDLVVFQGQLEVGPSRTKGVVLVFPRDYPNEMPEVFVKVRGGMQPIDLDPYLQWSSEHDSKTIFEAIKTYFEDLGRRPA